MKMEITYTPRNFPAFIYNKEFLSKEQTDQLIEKLDLEQQISKESHVFNPVDRANVVNKHMRSSRKIEYRDEQLFDWVEQNIVDKLNRDCSDYQFSLIRNDLEVVKYGPGDFFKAHQDYVNFHSNVFTNLTFIMCLEPCEEGGETVLHGIPENYQLPASEDKKVFEGTARNPGGILVLQKETIHEGLAVIKGNKTILKGNLVCFQAPKQPREDYIVIKLMKEQGEQVVLPYKSLEDHPDCIYRLLYEEEKSREPGKNVVYVEEEKLTGEEFWEIMRRMKIMEPEESKINEKLDFLGLSLNYTMIGKFHRYLQSEEKIFSCSMRDYYELLSLVDPKIPKYENVIPFQLITFETEGTEIVAWCGIYDNRLVCCDYYISGVSDDSEDWDDDEEGQNNQQKCARKLKASTLKYDMTQVLPERQWRNVVNDQNNEGKQMIRDYIWNKYRLQPLNMVVTNNKARNRYEMMKQFIEEAIDDASFDGAHDNADGTYKMKARTEYKKCKDCMSVYYGKESIVNISPSTMERIKPNELIAEVLKIDVAGYLTKASMSDFFCNETYYVTYNVICRFGFMKLSEAPVVDPLTPPPTKILYTAK